MASDFIVAWQFSQKEQIVADLAQHPYPTRSLLKRIPAVKIEHFSFSNALPVKIF
jgi:hypothetical protein